MSVWFRRTCWIMIAVHLATILAFVFSEIFICTPVAYSWHYWDGLHMRRCANRAAQLYALGAINICYDVVVFVLPLHNFLKLNISWQRKTGVLTIFMVGMLVTICSIVSAVFNREPTSTDICVRSACNILSRSAILPTPPGSTTTRSSGPPWNATSA